MAADIGAIADAIIALVNASPRTPTREEIVAVINFEDRRAAQAARAAYVAQPRTASNAPTFPPGACHGNSG